MLPARHDLTDGAVKRGREMCQGSWRSSTWTDIDACCMIRFKTFCGQLFFCREIALGNFYFHFYVTATRTVLFCAICRSWPYEQGVSEACMLAMYIGTDLLPMAVQVSDVRIV